MYSTAVINAFFCVARRQAESFSFIPECEDSSVGTPCLAWLYAVQHFYIISELILSFQGLKHGAFALLWMYDLIGHLFWKQTILITMEDSFWMVAFLVDQLLQSCQKCGNSFFISRHSLSSNFYIFKIMPVPESIQQPLRAINGLVCFQWFFPKGFL